jgi:hypothetical protein
MKRLLALFFFPLFLFSFDGMIHLHIDDLNSFYKVANNNKVFNKINTSGDWSSFTRSKLYIRIFEDIKNMDSNNKILDFKNMEKLPNASIDFYLMNIESERFVAKIKLEKSQSTALLNIDLDKLENISFLDKTIYKYQKINLVLDNDFLYLSNNIDDFKSYLKDNETFNTNVKLDGKYKNYMYLNLSKIKKTPYLNNYWFTTLKNFSDIDFVTIQFNLDNKIFEESAVMDVKVQERVKNLKIIEGDFKINLFNENGNFQVAPFVKNKDIKIYSMVSNDFKSIVYLAKYKGDKDFKEFLKSINTSSKIVGDDVFEYHYGLMNRKLIYFKIVDKDVLFSDNAKLLKAVTLKKSGDLYQKVKILNLKDVSKKIVELSKLDKNNYSYNNFLNSYLKNYMSIKSFEFDMIIKDSKKLEFNSKIIF